jgi:hypothetical protein
LLLVLNCSNLTGMAYKFPKPTAFNKTFLLPDGSAFYWNQDGKPRMARSQGRLVRKAFLKRHLRRIGPRKVSPSTARWERKTGRR